MSVASAPFEAFFLPVEGARPSQRFCLFHPAQGGCTQGSVLYVHPFAEEMNKSRRMAALQSRALANAGFNVLQIDLLGCGDSSGDFGDATWQAWVDDVLRGVEWLRQRDKAPLWLWGLRAGCLLATDAARQAELKANFLFWAPTPSGKTVVQQFLRLKTTAQMLDGGGRGGAQALRQQLALGAHVEVAGYMLGAGLVTGMENAEFPPTDIGPGIARIEWVELASQQDGRLSPAATRNMAMWQELPEARFRSHSVIAPSFWQTTEIEESPALIETTVRALAGEQE
jgi:exosortase A-associated hydrolase 2